jgi:hypothetical protein
VKDGSPAGFVLTALDNAHLPRPQESWGYIILEQEASSVLKRSDEVSLEWFLVVADDAG